MKNEKNKIICVSPEGQKVLANKTGIYIMIFVLIFVHFYVLNSSFNSLKSQEVKKELRLNLSLTVHFILKSIRICSSLANEPDPSIRNLIVQSKLIPLFDFLKFYF